MIKNRMNPSPTLGDMHRICSTQTFLLQTICNYYDDIYLILIQQNLKKYQRIGTY